MFQKDLVENVNHGFSLETPENKRAMKKLGFFPLNSEPEK